MLKRLVDSNRRADSFAMEQILRVRELNYI